jgi:hypothetical protein
VSDSEIGFTMRFLILVSAAVFFVAILYSCENKEKERTFECLKLGKSIEECKWL